MNLVQYRMARAALDWTSRQVAAASGLPLASINKLQAGAKIADSEMHKLQQAFEAAEVIFLDYEGADTVTLKRQESGRRDLFLKPGDRQK